MNIANEFRKLISYLLGKKTELQDLDVKDIVLAKVILDIHRKRTRQEFVKVPLFNLKLIHQLDRETALQAIEKRVQALQSHKEELLSHKEISREFLAEHLPSISWIKVVKENDNSFLAYEGNGRLVALQRLFKPTDDMVVEIELYHFRNPQKILRRLNRVRRLNALYRSEPNCA